MKKLVRTFISHSYLPSWLVMFNDLFIYITTFILTYWLSVNFTGKPFDNQLIIFQVLKLKITHVVSTLKKNQGYFCTKYALITKII